MEWLIQMWLHTVSGLRKDDAGAAAPSKSGWLTRGVSHGRRSIRGARYIRAMMTKWLIVTTAAICCVVQVQAQTTWQHTYGGYSTDEGNSVLVNAEGNYLIVGSTGSFGAGGGDVYVLLLDPTGQKIWSTTLGGAGVEQGRQAVQALDGGYVIVGTTNSSGSGGYDGYVVKIDALGNPVWERTFGGANWDFLHSIAHSDDGGYVVAGQTHSAGNGGGDAWALKLDEAGFMQWERTYGGDEEDFARSIITTTDGGYMIAGGITTAMDQNAWLVNLDSAGEVIWDVQVGGDSLDYANSVIQTADGGYAAVGVTKSFSMFTEALHFKVDEAGIIQNMHNWGQINDQESFDQVELNDGRLLSVGYVNSAGSGGKDMFLLFTDSDGGFISGVSNGGDNGAGDESGAAIAVTSDGGYLFCGFTESFGYGIRDVYVVKTDSDGITASIAVDAFFDPLSAPSLRLVGRPFHYPNPASGIIGLEGSTAWARMGLFDLQGRELMHWSAPPARIDVSSQPSGTYLLRAIDYAGNIACSPLILNKP